MEAPSRHPPAEVKQWLQDIREVEAAMTISNLIGGQQSILNVGPSWGRDYYHQSRLGKHIINADIAPQRHLESIVICDITRGLPFRDMSFNVVLMAEILEHLVEDAAALAEARRVLRDDGLLIVTVPFYNDEAEFHVRIHSPRSIRRLLHCAGFSPVVYLERGGLISFPRTIHGLRRILRQVIAAERFNQFVIGCDRLLARRGAWLLRYSRTYGCYISARKAPILDSRQLNVDAFQH